MNIKLPCIEPYGLDVLKNRFLDLDLSKKFLRDNADSIPSFPI